LKNLFDHFPKQVHKAFGIVTGSTGPLGGMRATQQLQLYINALSGIASPYMIVTPHIDKKFNADGELIDGTFQANIDTFTAEFLWLAERVTA
jgi:NAD(P)H-dependent FMN reductase